MKDKYGNENAKFELVQSVGLLYLKDGNAGENAPDIGGPVTVDLGNGQTVSQKFGEREIGSMNIYIRCNLSIRKLNCCMFACLYP